MKLDLDLKYKKVDEPEYEDLGAVKSEIGTYNFDSIMTMFIIYINNDYDDEDKKLRIDEIISDAKKRGLFKKYLTYKKKYLKLKHKITN